MDVVKAILARHSTRDFKPEPVARETVLKILDTATHSPSSANTQPWEIFVAGGEVLEKIRQAYSERFEKDVPGKPEVTPIPPNQWTAPMQERMHNMRTERWKLQGIDPKDQAAIRANMANGARFFGAPVLVVLCMDRALSTMSAFDIGLLTQNILLAAQDSGVGSIVAMNHVAHPDILRKELAIPDNLQIVIGVALGYPNTKSIVNTYRSSRRPIKEVVTFKGF